MNRTIRANLAYFLGRDRSMDGIEWKELADKMTNEHAEVIVKNIPARFKLLTERDISRYSEMEILEMIIRESLLALDTRLGVLQYFARKRLLELHFDVKGTENDSDSHTRLSAGTASL